MGRVTRTLGESGMTQYDNQYIRQLQILLAYEREEITETSACKLLKMFRVDFRGWAQKQYTLAASVVAEERQQTGSSIG
jgi:hypothetical protein